LFVFLRGGVRGSVKEALFKLTIQKNYFQTKYNVIADVMIVTGVKNLLAFVVLTL